jgi:hypothetical protein
MARDLFVPGCGPFKNDRARHDRLRHVTKPKQTWWKKWLAKEENSSGNSSSGKEEVEVTSANGDSNPESGSSNPDGKEDR